MAAPNDRPERKNEDANQLLAHWTRHDWREVLTAPNLCVLQALAIAGATASGAGDTREEALECCLGETAEIAALAALHAAGLPPVATGHSGVAAHSDDQAAQRLAVFEAHERAAIWSWWLGQTAARPVAPDWVAERRIDVWLDGMRQGAVQRRKTGVWLLDHPGPVSVAVGHSHGGSGQDPILGFGADLDPERSVRKALRETLLMELNLGEVLAARSGHSDQDTSAIENKIALYVRRCPALLGTGGWIEPAETPPGADAAIFDGVTLRDITPTDQLRRVWSCTLPNSGDFDLHGQGSPFM
ncbi:YcaO-like family protein [Pseudophaeobacter sp.]|uniref:YcaO-like family protein n=1 Tax=Pseudophaeobacter sp. TaxID=1971739 RepID=UPI003298F94E